MQLLLLQLPQQHLYWGWPAAVWRSEKRQMTAYIIQWLKKIKTCSSVCEFYHPQQYKIIFINFYDSTPKWDLLIVGHYLLHISFSSGILRICRWATITIVTLFIDCKSSLTREATLAVKEAQNIVCGMITPMFLAKKQFSAVWHVNQPIHTERTTTTKKRDKRLICRQKYFYWC